MAVYFFLQENHEMEMWEGWPDMAQRLSRSSGKGPTFCHWILDGLCTRPISPLVKTSIISQTFISLSNLSKWSSVIQLLFLWEVCSEQQKSMPSTPLKHCGSVNSHPQDPECSQTVKSHWENSLHYDNKKNPTPTQLSVTRVTFVRVHSLITFLLLCNGASKSLPANCCFRCLPLSVSYLWSKCSPLCLLHLVAFALKISILWQLPKAVTFCIHAPWNINKAPYPTLMAHLVAHHMFTSAKERGSNSSG